MTGNLLTLADARADVKQYVNGGSCDNSVIDARIAECEQRLWNKLQVDAPRLAMRRMRVRVQNRILTIPFEVENVVHVDTNGSPAHVFGPAYEFLSSGPGDLDVRGMGTCYKDLVDMGEHPTQFDIPHSITVDSGENLCTGTADNGLQVLAIATYIEDLVNPIRIEGFNRTGDEIHTTIGGTWTSGEDITPMQWTGGVEGELSVGANWAAAPLSTNLFKQITRVRKSATKGPVYLYAIEPSTNYMWLLSKMVPEATIPSYRRYKITNQSCTDADCSNILCWVRIRFRKAVLDADILSIQNVSALKLMSIAIDFENKFKLQEATVYEAKAMQVLLEEKNIRSNSVQTPVIIDVERELSNSPYNYAYNR